MIDLYSMMLFDPPPPPPPPPESLLPPTPPVGISTAILTRTARAILALPVKMCLFTGIPMTLLKVWFKLEAEQLH